MDLVLWLSIPSIRTLQLNKAFHENSYSSEDWNCSVKFFATKKNEMTMNLPTRYVRSSTNFPYLLKNYLLVRSPHACLRIYPFRYEIHKILLFNSVEKPNQSEMVKLRHKNNEWNFWSKFLSCVADTLISCNDRQFEENISFQLYS